jgi:hypothetical protein
MEVKEFLANAPKLLEKKIPIKDMGTMNCLSNAKLYF